MLRPACGATLLLLGCVQCGWSQPAGLAEGTRAELDIPYVTNGHARQKLDLFIPPGEGRRPLLIWVHGGAWKQGDKERNPAKPATMRGVAVAGVNYRLSQHAPFPAQIQDCQAALRWLRGNADKYGLDPDRVVVWGGSAGGHLVTLMGTASDARAWEPIGEHRDQSVRVQGVINWFGPADLTGMSALPNFAATPVGELLGNVDDNLAERLKVASPITYISADDPPFLIMHGDQDRTVNVRQSRLLHDALQQAQVPSELVILPGVGHGGKEFVEEPQREKIATFLRKVLLEPSTPAARTK
jgi:acetyl esterase/lipase